MRVRGLNIEHHVLPGRYVAFLYNQAGSLVRWFRDTFASQERSQQDGQAIYDALASEMPGEPTELLVLPCFDPGGPPRYLPGGNGAILGLRTTTSRGDILKAIMESATYYSAAALESLAGLGVDTSEFVVTGGGAKSGHSGCRSKRMSLACPSCVHA